MAPLEHHPMLANQGERPLLRSKLGAFFYPHFGPLAVPAECREDGNVWVDPQRVIPPMARCDHPAVEIQDPVQLLAFKRGDWAPVPGCRERRDDAQALFTFGWGCRAALNDLSSLRSSAISSSSSHRRALTGSTSSPHGVP